MEVIPLLEQIGEVAIGLIAVLILIVIWLIVSRNKAVREQKQAKKNLEDTLANLEAVYSEVNTTQEELNAKYRELKTSEEKIKKLAYEDRMTGLPNKAAFTEVLDHTLETLRRDESVAIMMIDLDHFKTINDSWGTSYGDELMMDISHRIKQNLDENDYLARNGSDEFLILSQNILSQELYEGKVMRMQKAFRYPFVLSVGEFMITVSIGVVFAPKDGKSASVLMRRADAALNQAKWLGKDTYCFYSDALEQKQLEDMELRTELSQAIRQNDFLLRYQPILLLDKKTCKGFRTEIRWDRKEKGIWRDIRFVKFADDNGQIIALAEWMFRQICQDRKLWLESGEELFDVVIPVTRRLLMSSFFRQSLAGICEEYGVSISGFVFELNERTLISDYEDCRFLIEELNGQGYRFRIGDFGSGRMSFHAIADLPVEQVALSIRRFMEERDAERAGLYFAVVTDAVRKLGHSVIAVDVDDLMEEQMVTDVIQSDVTVQGELYGESLTAEEVAEGWQKRVSLC